MEKFYNREENILGEVVKRNNDGTVVVDFAGTVLTLPETDNDLVRAEQGLKISEFKDLGDEIYEHPSGYSIELYLEKGDFDYDGTEITENRYNIISPEGFDGTGEHYDLPTAVKVVGFLMEEDEDDEFKRGGRTKEQQRKINYVMREFANNKLRTSGGTLVTNPKQAYAIAASEANIKKYDLGGKLLDDRTKIGRTITLSLPNGEKRKAAFALVEADNIIASHNHNTFYSSEGFPVDENGDNINDRNYKDDVNLQNAVIKYASDLEPERLITTSRTPSGTPIVSPDGIVVSGNNRTMSLKRAMVQYPENYQEYKNYLAEEIMAYGLSPDDLSRFNNPILVRIDYDIPELNTLEMSKYNKDTKKGESPLDKAVKLGKQLAASDNCKEQIGQIVGEYETFSDFYSHRPDQKRLVQLLIECNILTEQELPSYFDETFTAAGKELLENLLAGLVLNKESLIITNDVARRLRQIIITSLPVLSANSTLVNDSLIPALNEAISIEGKIRNSGLSFDTWINQLSMFEDRPARKALILNRLLASGRNNFKKAFEKYNERIKNSTGDMFGDAPSTAEIFNAYIVGALPADVMNLIDNNVATDTPTQIAQAQEETSKKDQMKGNPFANSNYFDIYPENILAKKESGISRWKKPITKYVGSIEDVDRIDVPENFKNFLKDDNPVVSVVDTPVEELTDKNVETIDNIDKALKESDKNIRKKRTRKARAKAKTAVDETEKITTGVETYTLKEVYGMDNLNEGISIDDLRAFLWYQNKKGRTIKNPEWYEIAETSLQEITSDKFVSEWIKAGAVFYYKGDLYPAYEYLSGNVYDKYNALVVSELSENVGNDAQVIIETYGKDVYDRQVLELTKIFQRKYDKRLVIKSEGDETGLKLLPKSKFAKNFYINTLIDEMPFKWKKVTAKSKYNFGLPDFLTSQSLSDWDKEEFEQLSLTNAFQYWIRTDKTVTFKQGMNYATIIEYYFQNKPKPRTEAIADEDGKYRGEQKKIYDREVAAYERLVAKAKSEGDRLFAVFLDKQLTLNDKVKLETQWNMKFNNNVTIDYSRIPVAFRMNKFIHGEPLDVRPEKREAVAFTLAQGSGLLAYDVGVGKTPSAIFTVSAFIDMGYCDRPLFIVPNQTYKQWISEFNNFCGHIQINGLYNLNQNILDEWTDENGNVKEMPAGSVTIVTYEGMKKIGFNEETAGQMEFDLWKILSQDTSEMSDKETQRQAEKTNTKVNELIGKALARTSVSIEDFNFDYVCLDEAHAAKKVFTNVAGEAEEHLGDSSKKRRPVVSYKIQSGTPSATAIKAFAITQYVQNRYAGNTQLLTATPFTNSPLEVYSMLSMIAHNRLVQMGLENIHAFFDTFIEVSYELIINAKLNPERRQIILGFSNLLVLQQLVKLFINHKTGEAVNVQRPNKFVLPLKNKLVDGTLMRLPEDEQVDSVLPLSDMQKQYMESIKQYAEGKIDEGVMCAGASIDADDEVDEDAAVAEGIELDEDSLDADEKAGVRLLKAMNHARNLALSPYLFDCAGLGKPTAKQYVETSNKLRYVMDCVKSIKTHHEKTKTPMSGVVLYIERGVEYFTLLRDYLIDELKFEPHEVGIISSKLKLPAPSMPDEQKKEYVKNLFLGKKFNEQTGEYDKLSDKDRMKVLIGSSTIKEGINLQSYSSTLFNCFLPWNPTDVQQMEGRIYRQGNAFNNVRIVNPLMVDSIDIFMFQKLEEKTSRINSVWETDGETNVLKTEEFNPKELKYTLIKDARTIARMEIIEDREKLDEAKTDLENTKKRIEAIKEYQSTIDLRGDDFRDWLREYRPKDADKPLTNALKSGQILLKKQTDQDGLPLEPNYGYIPTEDADGNPIVYSTLKQAYKPSYMDNLVLAVRQIERFERDYLVPTGRKMSQLDAILTDIDSQIENQQKLIEELSSDENIQLKVSEIERKRAEMDYREKTYKEVVSEFDKLNYLLDDVKLPKVKKVKALNCPVVDESGKPKIDLESIRLMDECSKRQQQTIDMHSTKKEVDGNTIYELTPERKKLHDEIYADMTKNAVCIEQEQPIAILMGGAPGSGKSSFLRKNAKYMTSDKIWSVDADEVRAYFPEYKGWNSGATHEEARMVVNRLISNYDKPCKHDLLYDGTMKNARKYIPIIKQLKKDGYKTFIAYMQIPKEISIDRAMKRYRDNNNSDLETGRYVPLFVIEEFFETGDELFQQIKKMVDGYVKIDSLTGKIIEKGGEQIPKNRSYYPIFDEDAQEVEKAENKTQPADLSGAIDSLKILYKYETDKEVKKKYKGAIDSLKILQKYA